MSPDPKTVREIARKVIERASLRRDYIGSVISDHAVMAEILASGDRTAYGKLRAAVVIEQATATVTVSWPDEPQPADVVTAEQQQDGAVGRLYERLAALDADGYWRDTEQFRDDIGAVLAKRTALAARVAELESERDDDLCVLAAFLLPNRRPIEEWLCILANHFEARTNALMRDADRFAAARFRVDRVPGALAVADTDGGAE